jgi:hypothetical protein
MLPERRRFRRRSDAEARPLRDASTLRLLRDDQEYRPTSLAIATASTKFAKLTSGGIE